MHKTGIIMCPLSMHVWSTAHRSAHHSLIASDIGMMLEVIIELIPYNKII